MVEAKRRTVEEQLALYRKRKRREEELAAIKRRMWNYLTALFTNWRTPAGDSGTVNTTVPGGGGGGEPEHEEEEEEEEGGLSTAVHGVKRHRRQESVRVGNSVQGEQPPTQHTTTLDWVMLLLKVLMWLLLQKVFILLEFGAVFFIFSAFAFIWYNLRNEPKKEGEASAYSVFNPNCEAIDGTFTAEQFERELLHKM